MINGMIKGALQSRVSHNGKVVPVSKSKKWNAPKPRKVHLPVTESCNYLELYTITGSCNYLELQLQRVAITESCNYRELQLPGVESCNYRTWVHPICTKSANLTTPKYGRASKNKHMMYIGHAGRPITLSYHVT